MSMTTGRGLLLVILRSTSMGPVSVEMTMSLTLACSPMSTRKLPRTGAEVSRRVLKPAKRCKDSVSGG